MAQPAPAMPAGLNDGVLPQQAMMPNEQLQWASQVIQAAGEASRKARRAHLAAGTA